MSKKSKTLVEISLLMSWLVLSLWLGYRVYQSTKIQDATGAKYSNNSTTCKLF